MIRSRRRESGNVLVYILIAVALFAALSFAVANMMRGGGANLDQEQLTIAAGEIIQFGTALRGAVQGMRIDGLEGTEISFEHTLFPGYANGNCAGGRTDCRLFHPSGGGVSYSDPLKEWLDSGQSSEPNFGKWYVGAGVCFAGGAANCGADGKDNEDLILFLPWIDKALCLKINEKLGIANPGGNPPVEAGAWKSDSAKFTGTFAENAALNQTERTGCIAGSGALMPPADTYAFYTVLLDR